MWITPKNAKEHNLCTCGPIVGRGCQEVGRIEGNGVSEQDAGHIET